MKIDVGGRIAFVTGGASGIGAASAEKLAAAGARVIVADRKIDPAHAVAQRIGGTAIELDIAQEQSVGEVVKRVEHEIGPVDILVNCAGILQSTVPPDELPMEQWDRIVDVHLRGTYMVTVALGSQMARRHRGSIVTIASVAGMRSSPLHAYSPAKAALISLTGCLASEWGRSGVRVNAISPGFVPTPAVERGFAHGVLEPRLLAENSALGRLVEPDEIAQAVLFLASDCSSAITGVNLPVDAGYLVAGSWTAYGGVRPRIDR